MINIILNALGVTYNTEHCQALLYLGCISIIVLCAYFILKSFYAVFFK